MKRTLPILLAFMVLSSSSLFAQWTSLGSGISATDRVIWGISVVDENVIWGITSSNPGFYPTFEFARTTDGGSNWTSGLIDADSAYFPIQIHALNDTVAWVATADEQDPISGRVYKTTDGGATWTEQSTGFTGFNETPAGIYFWDEDTGVAFGATGYNNYDDQISIYTTENGGDTWTKVTGSNMPIQESGEGMWIYAGNGFFTVVDDHIWFVTNSDRLFRSTDRGKSWTAHSTSITNPYGLASVAFKDTLNGIVVNWDPDQGARTTDGGITWEPITIPSSPNASQIEYIPGTEGTYVIHHTLGDGTNAPASLAISHNDGDEWCIISVDANPVCLDFLSPTVGFAGGKIDSATEGGFFKWTGDAIACPPSNVLERSLTPLNISPNPTDQFVTVQLPENVAGQTFTLEVRDLNGRLLRRQASPNTTTLLDLGELPSGVYLIEVFSREEVWGEKVVKR